MGSRGVPLPKLKCESRPKLDTGVWLIAKADIMRTCPYCKAHYKPQKWRYGYYLNGTAAEFISVGKLSEDQCPVCHKEHPKEGDE